MTAIILRQRSCRSLLLLRLSIEALILSVKRSSALRPFPRSTNSLPGVTDKAQHDNAFTAINTDSGKAAEEASKVPDRMAFWLAR
jgi:hypothetical protein